MVNEEEFQNSPEESASSIREELLEIVQYLREEIERRQGFTYPESAEQELIALCELMQEVPSEEDSLKTLPKDLSVFFTDQDGSETSGIIRAVRAALEYAPEEQRPELIKQLEKKIADNIKPDTNLSLSLLALLGIVSQYRTDNRASGELLRVDKDVMYPFVSLSPSAKASFRFLLSINRPYTNVASHKILDFLEHYISALVVALPEENIKTIRNECAKRFYAIADSMVRAKKGNFLLYARYRQLALFMEGVDIGRESYYVDASMRYVAKHIAQENESSYLVGKDDNPNASYYQLAPHYIAEYQKAGRMSGIYYATEEDYEALDAAKASATASITMSPRLQKWFQNSTSRLSAGEEVNILSFTEKRGDSPHHPLAKEDFFTALHPESASFDSASYDEYSYLMRPQMREIIETTFGITVSKHPLWVQRNFLSFFNQQGMAQALFMVDFIKQYGEDAFISFVATERDREFGETLINIGKRFEESAKPLFKKYAEIARTAYRAADYLRENFGGEATAEPTVRAFTENLLARGKELLRSAAAKKDQKELLAELDTIDEQTTMICAGVAAMKGQHIELADVKPFRMHVRSSKEMRDDPDATGMIRAAYEKTLRKEWGENPKVDRLLEEFDARVNDPKDSSRFYVILREDETKDPLIGSTVFTDTARGEKHWSALFFKTAYIGSGFYPSIIMQALEKESEDAKISGKTTVWKDIAASYIERAKFEGVSFHYDDVENDGALIIERPIEERAKPEIPEELPAFSSLVIEDEISEKKPVIAFEAETRDLVEPRMLEEMFAPLSHGYALRRYTKDAEHAQLVFEYRG